ncbi:hypothetical protein H8959_014567 [Pygathrix nigripes]
MGSQLGPAGPNDSVLRSPGLEASTSAFSDDKHTSSGHFFRVTAQKQVLLSLEGSRTLTVCPVGSVQPLSSQSLRASSSAGTGPQLLLYGVVLGPQLGQLFHAQQDSTGEALVNFIQAEVRAPLCSHHSGTPSLKWLLCHGHHVDMGTSSSITGSRRSRSCHGPGPGVLPSRSHQAGRASSCSQKEGEGCRKSGIQGPRAGLGSWSVSSRRKLQQDLRISRGGTMWGH